MSTENWERLITLAGDLQAEILRGLLEAQGIPAQLSKEGAGRAIGLSVGPLGEAEILVPASYREAANQVLDDYYAGRYENQADQDSGEDDQAEANEAAEDL